MAIKRNARIVFSRLIGLGQTKFHCPICGYNGTFLSASTSTGKRDFCRCPDCFSAERHRLQKLVLDKVFKEFKLPNVKMLHFAPEPFFKEYFRSQFQEYISVDLRRKDVDIQCDIINLPFKNQEFDFVFASHVLEHVRQDSQALSEIHRVLKPGGIAVLPVPIINQSTVEYPYPNPHEAYHVRAPGLDYFDKYKQVFGYVKLFQSSDFPEEYQTYIYEDRSHYPNKKSPWRSPAYEGKYEDTVPVCWA